VDAVLQPLAAFAGAAEVGLFTAGYRFFELGVAVAITLAAPLVPVFGRAVGTGTLLAQARLALRLVLAAAGPGVVAAWVLADPLVRLLFGPDYAASVPVLRIADYLGIDGAERQPTNAVLIVVEGDHGQAALLVDSIQDQRQVVVKSLEANYQAIDGVAGATILGDGRVALIADVDALTSRGGRFVSRSALAA